MVLLSASLIAMFLLGAVGYAYRRIGIGEGPMFALLLASLVGGMINIPVARLHGRPERFVEEVRIFGMRYRFPVLRPGPTTVLAVNLGGAVIPTAVSLLLVIRNSIWWQAAVGVAVVAVLVHALARPVRGVGIVILPFIPPLLAAAVSLAVAPDMAAPVAYVSGTVGTLVGADLLNLHQLNSLGAGVASIGGAGTFDGVFLSGIVAVLLVAVA